MTLVQLLAGALVAVAPGSPPPAPEGTITKAQAEARLATCGSRKFESVAEFPVDGKMKRSRLELCAADSESAEQWITKLEKAEASVKAQTRLPESARFKLMSDLRTEIDRLKGVQSIVGIKGDSSIAVPKTDFAVSSLPAMPTPKNDFAVSTLPPMPTAKKSASTAFNGKAPPAPLTRKPQLSIKCLNPGGSAARCSFMASDTTVEVSADEDLASPVTLRFRRLESDREGEVRLAQLKRGDSVQMRVPAAICKGVVRAVFDVQVTGAGSGGLRYADVQGPFEKRC
jgi:hypothetical protein